MSREEQGKEKPFDVAKDIICMQSSLAISPGFQSSFFSLETSISGGTALLGDEPLWKTP